MCSIALRSNYLAFHRIWAHKVFVEIIHYTQKFWTFFAGLIALLGMVGLKAFSLVMVRQVIFYWVYQLSFQLFLIKHTLNSSAVLSEISQFSETNISDQNSSFDWTPVIVTIVLAIVIILTGFAIYQAIKCFINRLECIQLWNFIALILY